MLDVKCHRLAESNLLIVWPKGPNSFGIKLKSFIQENHCFKLGTFLFIGHPVPLPTISLRESEFLYLSGQDAARKNLLHRERYVPLLSPIIDCILTVIFLMRRPKRYDMYITVGLHLVLLGILLKSMGVVRQVTNIVMDYWPQKYNWPVLNQLYRLVNGWCLSHLDFIVDLAPTIDEVRIRDGIRVDPTKRIATHTPIDPCKGGFLPQEQLQPDSLVWTGAVGPECGFELVIEAIKLIARVKPSVTVNVISYAPFPDYLLRKIKEKGLRQNFIILGCIEDEIEFMDTVRKYRVGLAPYNPTISTNSKRYAGVARPWTYMACGVPPILTHVPPEAAEIEEKGAGMIIDYKAEALAKAMLALLSDDELHQRCRERGLELVYQRTTDRVFGYLLNRLGIPLKRDFV